MKIGILSSLILILLLTGCVHHSPFVDEYFFSSLGEEGEVVVTADVKRMREDGAVEILSDEEKENKLIKKSERVSLSLFNGDVSGALEGDISKTMTNLALHLSSSFEKVDDGEDSLKWYSGNGLNVYSPESGIVLFTSGSYPEYYRRTIVERRKLIDDETAERMACSLFSFYVFEPEDLSLIGLDIPETVRSEIKETCLLFDMKEGSLLLSGFINTKSESSARALNTLMRNQIVQEKRRSGESVDYKALSSSFSLSGTTLKIEGYVLTGESRDKTLSLIKEKFGGII